MDFCGRISFSRSMFSTHRSTCCLGRQPVNAVHLEEINTLAGADRKPKCIGGNRDVKLLSLTWGLTRKQSPWGEEMGPKHLDYKENLSTKSHYTIANYNQRYKQQNCHSDSIWTCLRQHRGEREGLSRAITPIWLAGFTASFLSLCLVQSLKAIIFGAGSKDWNNLDLSQICLMLPIDFFFPFKNKWTTLTVQMALFPITGSGGFSSSHRNTQITT